MATLTTVILTDSLDERIKNGVEDVVFFNPLTGEKLEIQLGEANRRHFANHLEKLAKYVDAATVVEVPVVENKPKATTAKGELALIREWAKTNGFSVGDRGRIKADIVDAYHKAQEAKSSPDTDAQASGDEPVKLVETSDESPETEAVFVELSEDEQAEIDALLAEVTGETVTQADIDEMLAEIDSEDDSK